MAKSLAVNRAQITLHSEVTVSFPDQPPAHATKTMIIHMMLFIALKYSRDGLMPLDINKYQHFLDDADISEQRKSEFIQDVWNTLEQIVDSAWGTHPVQFCQEHKVNTDLQGAPESIKSKDDHSVQDFN